MDTITDTIINKLDDFSSYRFDENDKFILDIGSKKRESQNPNDEILKYNTNLNNKKIYL